MIQLKKINSLKSMLILSLIIIQSAISFGQTPQYSKPGGTYSNSIPLRSASNNRRDAVYYPSDFASAPAGFINTIYLNVSSSVTSSFSNLLITMGSTSLSTFSTGPWTSASSLDTVFYSSSTSLSSNTSNWIPIVLQTPFYYNGTSNLIVSFSQSGYSPGIYLLNHSITDRSHYASSSSATASPSNRLPNFGFDITIPVSSSNDAGITEISGFMDTICNGNLPVDVVLKNYGPDTLNTVDINWNVNSILQTPYSWVGTLNVGDSAIVTLGNYNFLGGTAYNLNAYTSNPNGNLDTITVNDTSAINAMYSRMNPVLNLGSDTTIYWSQTLTLNAGAGFTNYLWSTGASTQSIMVDSSGIGAGSGVFSVTATDAFGCISQDSIQVTFVTGVSIAENQATDFFKVFPNPASDKVSINFSKSHEPFKLEVIDYAGKKVFETTGNNSLNVNTTSWSSGLYVFVLTHNGETTIKKVVIE